MRRLIRVLVLSSPLLLFLLSLAVGERTAGPALLFRALSGQPLSGDSDVLRLLVHIRLPLTLQAFLCGGLLAVSGAALQAVLRNPLAEPYVLGVSSGSAFGMVSASLLGVSGVFWMQFGAAFGGGLLAVGLVLGGALRRKRPLNMVRLILLGVAVNAFFFRPDHADAVLPGSVCVYRFRGAADGGDLPAGERGDRLSRL